MCIRDRGKLEVEYSRNDIVPATNKGMNIIIGVGNFFVRYLRVISDKETKIAASNP